MGKRSTTEEFIKKARKIHGNKYDYVKVEYVDNKTKVKIYCKRCNTYFYQTPNIHLRGGGCDKCNHKEAYIERVKRAAKSFIIKAKQIHGDKYNYDDVDYKNAKLPVRIKCNTCGHVFYQNPNNHLRGQGCSSCYGNTKKTKEQFIENARKIHGNKYDYSKVVYKNNRTPMKIKCNKCNKYFYQDAGNHLSGQGCPYCASSNGEKKIAEILTNNTIEFKQEYIFKDCKDKRVLPFDFYLPLFNVCIEFQGKQHYKEGFSFYLSYNRGNVEKATLQFEKTRYHDKLRREYCAKNNIVLLEIKYDENIEEKLQEYFKW